MTNEQFGRELWLCAWMLAAAPETASSLISPPPASTTIPIHAVVAGARVQICGRTATVLFVNDSRARVRYDSDEAREFTTAEGRHVSFHRTRELDISPTTEVDLVT